METTEETKIDMKEMMKTYQKVGTPGAPHQRLAKWAGKWTTKTRGFMGPDEPPMESTGTCEAKMIFDGRYLQQEYTGEMMGNPFTGINLIGYDNHAGKYVSTWIDSMSTAIYCFEGAASADGRTISQECSYDDPVRGPLVWRSVTTIVDDDTLKYDMYITPKGGREAKEMEMTLTRT